MKEIHRSVIIKVAVPDDWEKMSESEQLGYIGRVQANGTMFSVVKIKTGNHGSS